MKVINPAEIRADRIKKIVKRDGPLCFYPKCEVPGKKFAKDFSDATFDHWIPQSRGGTWDIENLRLMHKRCNAVKSDDMPNPDGTLPDKKRAPNAFERRLAKKAIKVEVCNTCMSGRILLLGEQCGVCGSGPMPSAFPQSQKKTPKECDHNRHWCWACIIGIIDRQPAILDVLDSEGSLD